MIYTIENVTLDNIDKSRHVFEYLCDGKPEVALFLTFIKSFKEKKDILLWLYRNKIKGDKVVELIYFKGNRSHLKAVEYILDRVHGRRFISEKVNADDLVNINPDIKYLQ